MSLLNDQQMPIGHIPLCPENKVTEPLATEVDDNGGSWHALALSAKVWPGFGSIMFTASVKTPIKWHGLYGVEFVVSGR